jgi:hypothetical protein
MVDGLLLTTTYSLLLIIMPTSLFINEDLKYFAQMLGHDGMSTSCCMWCQAHPNEWKGLFSVPAHQLWSISQQVEYVQRIKAGVLKKPKEKKGIVSMPPVDFIEPKHYIFPQLHFEIGAVNNVLEYLRGFIRGKIEIHAEREARNTEIIAYVSYVKANDKLHDFNTTRGSVELNMYRLERVCIVSMPLIDFIEPKHYIFPQLHFEI